MKTLMMMLMMVLMAIPALGTALGTEDTPARFSGLGMVDGPVSWPSTCGTVGFRSEDLPDPAYLNRFHILVQLSRGCPDIPDQAIEGPVMVAALPDGRMQMVVYEWNLLLMPTDPEIRQWMAAASRSPNGGFEIRRQKLTISKIGDDLFEFLVEEPKP